MREREAKHWFHSDHFLWGWYPVAWQGWAVLVFYLVLILFGSWVLLPHNRFEAVESIQFLAWLIMLAVCFLSLLLVVWTTGGRPQKEDDHAKDR